jgi:hypothetical protein
MKKVVRLTESDLCNIIKQVINEEFDYEDIKNSDKPLNTYELEALAKRMETDLKSYYEKNKETIDKYYEFKHAIDVRRHIEQPKFTLLVINNAKIPYIIATVKFPFEYNGKKTKNGHVKIYIGSERQFPELLDTPNIYEISRKIITQKLDANT